MPIKLTPPQLSLLKERQGRFIATYKPGLKLLELRFIDATSRAGADYIDWTINAAGEAFLLTQVRA